MQIEPSSMTSIVNRAKRAHGHLAKVIAMMEDGADCEDVLTQFAAVTKALDRAAFSLVATGLTQCITEADRTDGADGDHDVEVDVARLQKLFLTLA